MLLAFYNCENIRNEILRNDTRIFQIVEKIVGEYSDSSCMTKCFSQFKEKLVSLQNETIGKTFGDMVHVTFYER